jgi:sugar phosphate isomerase/epimerase
VRYTDIRLGDTGNEFRTFDDARIAVVRRAADAAGLHVGLHTLSAVNMAETAPYLREAVDEYIESYIDICARLGAGWIVMHGGFHFTGDYRRRVAAASRGCSGWARSRASVACGCCWRT